LKNDMHYFLSPHPDMIIFFTAINFVTYEIHANVLKKSRDLAFPLIMETIKYVFERGVCKKLVACIPDKFQDVLGCAVKCGFSKEGLITNAYSKNDILYDINIMGLQRGEICQEL